MLLTGCVSYPYILIAPASFMSLHPRPMQYLGDSKSYAVLPHRARRTSQTVLPDVYDRARLQFEARRLGLGDERHSWHSDNLEKRCMAASKGRVLTHPSGQQYPGWLAQMSGCFSCSDVQIMHRKKQ